MLGIPELTGISTKNKFEKCPYKHAMYIKKEVDGSMLFACLYVDDLIFIGNNPTMFKDFKKIWYKSLR
jgi:hypothetical protein